MAELDAALNKIKAGKSPGPDKIANDMLKQLSLPGKRYLLDLLNRSWTTAEVPASWQTAEIVAIPKKGKSLSELSYRPISLLSSTSRLAEQLVQARLQHWLKTSGRLNRNQAVFFTPRWISSAGSLNPPPPGLFLYPPQPGGSDPTPLLSRKRMDVERRTRRHSKDLDETLPNHFRKFKIEVTCQVKGQNRVFSGYRP